jgi:hypothetical protein
VAEVEVGLLRVLVTLLKAWWKVLDDSPQRPLLCNPYRLEVASYRTPT